MSTSLPNNCCSPQKLSVNNNTGYLSLSDSNSVYLGNIAKTLGIKTPVVNFSIQGFIVTLTYTDANGLVQNKQIDLSAIAQGGAITVTNTPSVNLTFASADLSANVNLSSFAGNSATIRSDGIYVPSFTQVPLTANDSSTIDFSTSGTNNMILTGAVKVSATSGNKITVNSDGLYVADMKTYLTANTNITITGAGTSSSPYSISAGGFSQTPLSVNDSSSLHLVSSGTNGMTLTGNVKISSVSANALVANSDGLYVPQSTSTSYTDAQARAAISAIAPVLYNSSTGVISESLANASTNGYLSSSDWSAFNNKISIGGNIGSLSSFPVYSGQSGTTLNFNGLRAGPNVAINQVGNDLVISASGTGGGSSAVFVIDFIVGDGGALTPTAGASQFNPTSNPLVGATILGVWVEGVKIAGVARTGGALYYTFVSSAGTITLTNGVFSADTYYSILYK